MGARGSCMAKVQGTAMKWGTCHYLWIDPFLQILNPTAWISRKSSFFPFPNNRRYILNSGFALEGYSLLPKPLENFHDAIGIFTRALSFGRGDLKQSSLNFIFPFMFHSLTSINALFFILWEEPCVLKIFMFNSNRSKKLAGIVAFLMLWFSGSYLQGQIDSVNYDEFVCFPFSP